MKRILTATILSAGFVANAQQYTYNHDVSKMNQITVQETGVGALTPYAYYQSLHMRYRQRAIPENKTALRTATGIAAFQQIETSEKLDSAMMKRAAIEALNIADRTIDLALETEVKRIDDKLEVFVANINRIPTVGGSPGQRDLWMLEFRKIVAGVRNIRRSSMPNSQRKKQYLRAYNDVVTANENLIRFLVYLQGNQTAAKLLSARYVKPSNNGAISKTAFERWRLSAINGKPDTGGGDGGDKDDGGIIVGPINPDLPDKPIGPDLPDLELPTDSVKPDEPDKPDDSGDDWDFPNRPVDPPDFPDIILPDSTDTSIKPVDPNEPLVPVRPSTGDLLKPKSKSTKTVSFNTIKAFS